MYNKLLCYSSYCTHPRLKLSAVSYQKRSVVTRATERLSILQLHHPLTHLFKTDMV